MDAGDPAVQFRHSSSQLQRHAVREPCCGLHEAQMVRIMVSLQKDDSQSTPEGSKAFVHMWFTGMETIMTPSGTVWRLLRWTQLIWRLTSDWHGVCLSSSTWLKLWSAWMISKESFQSRRTAVPVMPWIKTSRLLSSLRQNQVFL